MKGQRQQKSPLLVKLPPTEGQSDTVKVGQILLISWKWTSIVQIKGSKILLGGPGGLRAPLTFFYVFFSLLRALLFIHFEDTKVHDAA